VMRGAGSLRDKLLNLLGFPPAKKNTPIAKTVPLG
jgi:hypothetical protein